MDPTIRMLRQIRCLAPALVAAARAHAHDCATLERVVERLLGGPVATLVRLLERRTWADGGEAEREEARAVVEAVRLLALALRRAIAEAPMLEAVIHRLTDGVDTPAETAAVEIVAADIDDLIESGSQPHGAIDPIAACRRLHGLVRMPERHH